MGSNLCLERNNNHNDDHSETNEFLFGSKYNPNKNLQVIFNIEDIYKSKLKRRRRRRKSCRTVT